MKKAILLSIAVCVFTATIASADSFGTGENQFEIEFIDISSATNPVSGYGIVNNDYRMGMYEITNEQWDKFVNIYGTPVGNPGIPYDSPALHAGKDLPTHMLSWYEAAQFVNWLNVSSGHQAAYKFTGPQGTGGYTLGVWEPGDLGYNSNNPYRNSKAYYFLPTEHEWVKAAYWNGTSLQDYALMDGDVLYSGSGSDGGWNYFGGIGSLWNVGSGSEELNGTFDMMGNVLEWTEGPWLDGDYLFGSSRVVQGGAYNYSSDSMGSSWRYLCNPANEWENLGFRVASVPEPTTLSLLALGAFLVGRKKRQ